MAIDVVLEHLDTSVTRRRIVKTGVRLAYTAPIVAASFKLGTGLVGAVSRPGCQGNDCVNADLCESTDGLCFCLAVAGINEPGFCHRCQRCSTAPGCDPAHPACPKGSVCSAANENCCGVPKCLQPCAGTVSDCLLVGEVQTYDVAALATDRPAKGCGQTVCSSG